MQCTEPNEFPGQLTSRKLCRVDDVKKISHDAKKEHDKESFFAYFRSSKLPHPDNWPGKSPIFVSASKRARNVTYRLPQNIDGYQTPFPLNGDVVTFTGPLFQGKIVSRVRGADSISSGAKVSTPDNYFKGRSRQFQWTVQGVFSKKMRFDDLVTGQDFCRPFRNAPASNLVKKGLNLLKNRLPETFDW